MAFNAKNLTYENQEPAFLRKLKAQFGGNDGRQERPLPRPKKAKRDEADDEPTYVDEENQQTLTKAEFEKLAGVKPTEVKSAEVKVQSRGPDSGNQPVAQQNPSDEAAMIEPKKEAIAMIGTAATKRKAARIVGQEEDDAKVPLPGEHTIQKKKPCKGKKVKLSFDEA